MLFGEVVEADGVEGGFGDAFGAVDQGGDGCLADEAGEASDADGGALVQVGGQFGEGSGPVVAQVEGAFHGDDEVAEGLLIAEACGEGGAVDEGGAAA